ncbi:hypothetical protein CPB83DRAFT_853731 [Crepidotus variabilis]|uniref:F-box domain-containing protein n=1 Tax=Crepidotus variabilis TaxID=179855 RepID=A0A9P6EH29_9AGAR|nr:hypothetical protein CPB83DRAFT_853731 [Crepidotus variabilis]
MALVPNGKGFPSLPAELFLEILAYIPPLDLLHSGYAAHTTHDIGQEYRLTLSSLTKTCRSLRHFFLKLLWERIEVFDGMFVQVNEPFSGPKFEKLLACELLRQIEVVTKISPEVAHYVRKVNVVVASELSKTVLVKLAQCLQSLPNMHTAQLNFRIADHLGLGHFLSTYPIDTTLLQIRMLIVNNQSAAFMRACPNTTRVFSLEPPKLGFSQLVAVYLPKIEVMGPCVLSATFCQAIALSRLGRLREIIFDVDGFFESETMGLQSLPRLPSLQIIRLYEKGRRLNTRRNLQAAELSSKMISWAKRILANNSFSKVTMKRIIFVHHDESVDIIPVEAKTPQSLGTKA